jgi:transposase
MAESGPGPKVLLGDRAYDADPIRADVEARGGTPVIPTKRNRKIQIATDGLIYALRNRIERGINRLKNSRRVATRYDKPQPAFSASSNSLASGDDVVRDFRPSEGDRLDSAGQAYSQGHVEWNCDYARQSERADGACHIVASSHVR